MGDVVPSLLSVGSATWDLAFSLLGRRFKRGVLLLTRQVQHHEHGRDGPSQTQSGQSGSTPAPGAATDTPGGGGSHVAS